MKLALLGGTVAGNPMSGGYVDVSPQEMATGLATGGGILKGAALGLLALGLLGSSRRERSASVSHSPEPIRSAIWPSSRSSGSPLSLGRFAKIKSRQRAMVGVPLDYGIDVVCEGNRLFCPFTRIERISLDHPGNGLYNVDLIDGSCLNRAMISTSELMFLTLGGVQKVGIPHTHYKLGTTIRCKERVPTFWDCVFHPEKIVKDCHGLDTYREEWSEQLFLPRVMHGVEQGGLMEICPISWREIQDLKSRLGAHLENIDATIEDLLGAKIASTFFDHPPRHLRLLNDGSLRINWDEPSEKIRFGCENGFVEEAGSIHVGTLTIVDAVTGLPVLEPIGLHREGFIDITSQDEPGSSALLLPASFQNVVRDAMLKVLSNDTLGIFIDGGCCIEKNDLCRYSKKLSVNKGESFFIGRFRFTWV